MSLDHNNDNTHSLDVYRDRFQWPRQDNGERTTYLCGNSLGLQPIAAAERVAEVLKDWAELGVEGHFNAERSWLNYHAQATPLLAGLLHCEDDEVVAMNTLTVNLNLLMLSFYRPTPERFKILIEEDAFPSDQYAVQSQLSLQGIDPKDNIVIWRRNNGVYNPDDLANLLASDSEIAMMLIPGVQYLTGEWLDLTRIAALAREYDVTLGLDLAHAVGNVPIDLNAIDADFAAFCTYKYLNSGPGAIAGAWVNRRHHGSDVPRLHGWWGNDESNRFEMRSTFSPAPGTEVWQQSNPPILALAPVVASLEMFDAVGMPALREKSTVLTGTLRARIQEELGDHIDVLTPSETSRYGAQLSLALRTSASDGRQVFNHLQQQGVIGDWREPNVIRVAPAPLYNNLDDVNRLVDVLHAAIRAL
ncbi:MAG: kynureninase [Pseudomonadota bacterium]